MSTKPKIADEKEATYEGYERVRESLQRIGDEIEEGVNRLRAQAVSIMNGAAPRRHRQSSDRLPKVGH